MLKQFLVCVGLVLFLSTFALAQTTQVSGANVGNGSYTDPRLAFAAINSGDQTNAVIQVQFLQDSNLASAIVIDQGAWTSLTITPVGARRVTGFTNGGPLIDFNGADRVRINGIGVGGNSLVFENRNIGGVSTIGFRNDATSNVVENITVLGSSAAVNTGTIVFSTASAGGNDNNLISGVTFGGSTSGLPANAIYSAGSAGNANSGNSIVNCDIADFFSPDSASRGVFLNTNSEAWTIRDNRFYQTAPRTYTLGNTHAAIDILTGSGHLIRENRIGYALFNGSGVYTMESAASTRFIGINLAVGTGSATSVQGNLIGGISLRTGGSASTGNGLFSGINVTSGNVDIGTTLGNMIGEEFSANSIAVSTTAPAGLLVGISAASTGTLRIQNNSIGSLSMSGGGAVTGTGPSVSGIQTSGSPASLTISANRIGYSAVDDIVTGTAGTTTGSSIANGINIASMPQSGTVTGNTIQNLSANGTGSSGFVRGISTPSVANSLQGLTISSNVIASLRTNSTLGGVNNLSASAIGIAVAAGTGVVVEKNLISGISNTNAGATGHCVLGVGLANAINPTISANRIFGLSNAGTSASATAPNIVAGVLVRSGGGTVTVVNNMIAIGSGQSTDTAFGGIIANVGTTPNPALVNIFHNSVSIGGSASGGAQPSFGIARTDFSTVARTIPVSIGGNLVVNGRTGGTGSHYAIANNYGAAASSATGWSANSNVLDASAASVGYWSGARSFAGWQAASAGDAASFTNVPVNFVDPAADLHLNMGTSPTVLESNVVPVAGVTNDFDGDARPGPAAAVNGGGLLPDFGADEFDGAVLDGSAPVVTITGIVVDCVTSNAVVTATIIDTTGVAASGNFAPRLYFRKNGDTYFSSAGTLSGGSAQNGNWTFTLSSAALGGVAIGDTVSYFAVAQDTTPTPRTGADPSTGFVATDVNAIVAPPSNPRNFVVAPSMSGTYSVGSTGSFPTLTAAVAAYNSACLNGPVLLSLTDATYAAETAPITIGSNPFASPINRLTIKPAPGVSPVISVNSATSIVNLNGADFVTIDGSNAATANSLTPLVSASRDLTIQPTSTIPQAVIWLSTTSTGNPATNIVVQNVNVNGGGASVGIGAGGPTVSSNGTNNDNLSFVNNSVSAVNYGIVSYGSSAATKNQNLTISQNSLTSGIGFMGIASYFTNNIVISGNEIGNIANSTSGQDSAGVNLGFALGNTLARTATGIADSISNVVVTRNIISNITHSQSYSAVGVALGNSLSGTTLIANNMISDILSNGTSGDFSSGILLGGGIAPVSVVHNSVSISSVVPGTVGTTELAAALVVTSGTSPTALTIRNNILSNTASSNDVSNMTFIAIGYQFATPSPGVVSGNNALIAAGGGPGTYSLGRIGGLDIGALQTTLAGWQSATGGDANSVSVAPAFVSPTDLHLTSANPQLLGAGQLVAGVDADFDSDLRDSPPDIGADELVAGRTGVIPAGVYRDANISFGTLAGDVRITRKLNLSGVFVTEANKISLDCGTTVVGAAQLSYIVGNVEKSFCAPQTFSFPVGTIPAGINPEFTPLTANVTAGTFPSSLTVSVTDGVLPGSLASSSASRYWNIAENGDVTADLTFTYLPQDVAGNPNAYQVLRRSGATTTVYAGGSVNAALRQGFAPGVTEFSSWGAGNLVPTAASGTLAGRVTTADGAGIRNAVVTISGGRLAAPIVVRTGTFGVYNVENLPVGETYVVTVTSARFRFATPSRVVNLGDSVADADFIADSQ